jgi:ADP-heptose:LPS heptosyltransferase
MIKSWARCIQSLALVIIDFLSTSIISRQSISVCFIRLDKIGDFILWLDSAKALHKMYPKRRITLIANSTWVELAEKLPYWDEVLPIDVRRLRYNLLYRWQTMRKIRRQGFGLAIQPTFSRDFLTGDSVMRATGAPERIGFSSDNSNILQWEKRISDRWYTHLVSADSRPKMELERNAEFIRLMGVAGYQAMVARLPTVAILPDALQIKKAYFIVFPGASWNGKQWPIENFAALIRHICTNTGWQAVLCGSSVEHRLCSMLAKETPSPVLNLAGRTNLPEFVELIRGANLLIGNDTSAIHIASAVETPSVCIFGGGHFGRFMPYPANIEGCLPVGVYREMPCFNCNWNCNQPHTKNGPVPCISGVSVDAVIAAANAALTSGDRETWTVFNIREDL